MGSSPPLKKPDVTLSLSLLPSNPVDALKREERGVKLIQLLLACAKHASSGNLHHADSCLRQISQLASVTGDSMHRLSAWFASALAVRLIKRWPGIYKALNHSGSGPSRGNLDRARSIFTRNFPYIGFAYSIINQTLTQSLSEDRIIHVIDLGSGDAKLWTPFLRSMAQVPDGPPELRITCVSSDKVGLENLEARLTKEAESLDMRFQFNALSIPLRDLTLDMLKVRSDEVLAFVSVLNLHVLLAEDDRIDVQFNMSKKNSGVKECKKMGEFLAMIRSLSPKLYLLVEQELDSNMNRLVDRFVEGLNYYSALFDSIDAGFGGCSCDERTAIEEMLGKEIENIVACEGIEREERHERCGKWMVRFGEAGFRPMRLWFEILEAAKRLVETFGKGRKGYKVSSERANLMISWHERPIYSVTAWTC